MPCDYLAFYLRYQQALASRSPDVESKELMFLFEKLSQSARDALNEEVLPDDLVAESRQSGLAVGAIRSASERFLRWLNREKKTLDKVAVAGVDATIRDLKACQNNEGNLRLRNQS